MFKNLKRVPAVLLLCLLLALGLAGCAGHAGSAEPSGPADNMGIVTDVQYLRTDEFNADREFEKLFWLSSAEALRSYTEETCPELARLANRYDEAFFAENDLLVVVVSESSGSNRLEVTGVKVTPSQTEGKQYVLQPEIQRLRAENGTADLAGWHILIGIPKDHGAAVSELAEPVFTEVIVKG